MSAAPCVLDTPLYILAPCGKCAHLHAEQDADGAQITLWDAESDEQGTDHMRWRIERAGPRGEGYFHIVNCHSGRAWCNPGGNADGVGVVTWDRARADDSVQVFFEPADKTGYWHILFRDGRKSAHVLGESEENGAAVATWEKEGRPHHWWRFEVFTRICTLAWDLQWRGFGCSLCWWANALDPDGPKAAAYADLLFSSSPESVWRKLTWDGGRERVPGLGLNVVRYNVGGGGAGNRWHPEAPEYKDIKGFWVKPWSDWDPGVERDAWDWEQDRWQRGWLQHAKARAGPYFRAQAFSNAPMHWMTTSKSTNGSAPSQEGFDGVHAGWHANYLVRVVARAAEKWGVHFDSIEPFNEPNETWWTLANSRQEGCHMKPATQAAVLRQLAERLRRSEALVGVQIACSDENSHRRAKDTWQQLTHHDSSLIKSVGLACAHSYEGLSPARDNAARVALRRVIGDKELWITEYGDGEGSGIDMATTIMHDLHYLRCRCWCYWQPIEPHSGWGLINVEYGKERHGATQWVYTKYWVFATFSRVLRPGMFVLASNAVDTFFAFDPRHHLLAIVALNTSLAAQQTEFDLSRAFGSIAGEYRLRFTAFDGSALLKDSGSHATRADVRRISLTLPAESVVTLTLRAWGFPPCPLGVPLFIVAGHCGKVAHLHGEENSNGARVTLWDRGRGEHLRWRLERASGRGFRIVSCLSGRAWRNPAGRSDGVQIVTWDYQDSDRSTEVVFEPTEQEGFWYISFVEGGRTVHVLRESPSNGAPVTTWSREQRSHHWWRLETA